VLIAQVASHNNTGHLNRCRDEGLILDEVLYSATSTMAVKVICEISQPIFKALASTRSPEP
jgi:hypothetical protein